ncbi:MAG: sigma-70 family RNA polymerase sigma factor [Oscillospiraceae bacterium]|nr:sigma-70 family RNA polymerase sigma factor [Oscillospiraceae bacterium]
MVVTLGPREEFIQNNLGLVHSCATRFRGRGIEYDDLFSAGCMGLVKAYDGFDETRGLCFSTYAVPVILGEIKKLFRDGGTLKVSRSIKELSLKINAVREVLSKQYGQEPTVSQIAERLEVSVEQVVQAINAAMPTLSLTPISDDEQGREFDIPIESHEEELADKLALREVLQELAPDDRQLILLRFFKNQTQSQTARIMNTTQVQISRRERKILLQLRNKLIT